MMASIAKCTVCPPYPSFWCPTCEKVNCLHNEIIHVDFIRRFLFEEEHYQIRLMNDKSFELRKLLEKIEKHHRMQNRTQSIEQLLGDNPDAEPQVNEALKYDCFISHSDNDKWWVESNLQPWLAKNNFKGFISSSKIDSEIEEFEKNQNILIILTPDYIEEQGILRDTTIIDKIVKEKTIIPIHLKDCVVTTPLLALKPIDLTVKFEYILNAAPSPAWKWCTYLNQGQKYLIELKTEGDLLNYKGKLIRSEVALIMGETQCKSWIQERPDDRLFDIDVEESYGIDFVSYPRFSTAEFTWDPTKATGISICVNCLSPDSKDKKELRHNALWIGVKSSSEKDSELLNSRFCTVKVYSGNGADTQLKKDCEKHYVYNLKYTELGERMRGLMPNGSNVRSVCGKQ